MMKIKLSLFLALAGVLIALPALGAVITERTPDGSPITSPVSFHITFDDFYSDICAPGYNYWLINVKGDLGDNFYQGLAFVSTTLDVVFPMTLPLDTYTKFEKMCCVGQDFGDTCGDYYGGDITDTFPFEIIAGPVEIINIGGNDFISGILAYVRDLFAGVRGVIFLIIGLPLGFWVLNKITGLIRPIKRS